MRISLEGLQIVDAINRRGSFAGAAEELFRVPSTITYAVQKLEEDLGFPLFQRNGHRPRLTPAGEELLKDGRLILQASADLEERLKRVAEGCEASLRIAVNPLLPQEPMLALVREFYDDVDHRQTDLRITHDATEGADLLLGPSRVHASRRLVGTVELVLLVGQRHPLASYRGPVPSSVLRLHRAAILAPAGGGLPQKSMTLPDVAAKVAALKAGIATGFLPRCLVASELAEGDLVELALAEPARRESFYLAWDERSKGKALRWWLERLDRPTLIDDWFAPMRPHLPVRPAIVRRA
jgi:DNA-binding transcriptional LysR family regulator